MEIILDLPWPPSQNSIWRGAGRHVYRSPKYMAWLAQAEGEWMIQRSKLKTRRIEGPFSCSITLHAPDKRRSDIDNRTKVCLDFCERMRIIENDYLCKKLSVVYGSKEDAPLGTRLHLESM